MKVVLNAEPKGYSTRAIQTWRNKGYEYLPSSWKEIRLEDSFPDVEILIVRLSNRIDREVLQKFPNLKKVISATTGHDHIDLSSLKERGIQLISLRGHTEFLKTIPSTAELAWGLLIALVRNIPSANEHVKSAGWNRDLFRGYQLRNKILGIVGYGRTGKKMAQYARSFDMVVKYFDPYVSEGVDEKVLSLEALMQQSDIVSYHVHLNAETADLLNRTNIVYLNKDAYLINTSRGKIWEEAAVAEAIDQNQIKGVAVDVIATEMDNIKQSPLWKCQQNQKNVIITPHIGGATWDAMWACEEYLIQNFQCYD